MAVRLLYISVKIGPLHIFQSDADDNSAHHSGMTSFRESHKHMLIFGTGMAGDA